MKKSCHDVVVSTKWAKSETRTFCGMARRVAAVEKSKMCLWDS